MSINGKEACTFFNPKKTVNSDIQKTTQKMNLISLGKTIVQNYFFMRALNHKLGEPVRLTKEGCEKVFEDLKADKMMAQKFALVYDLKNVVVSFHFNTEKFLSYKGVFDLNKFFMLVHPDFMELYIKWGQAIYSYLMQQQHTTLEPLNQCTRVTIPLKLSDGQYHWVLQEALPLEIDAENNLVSHLNIYTVLHPMEKGEKVVISHRLFNNGFEEKEWTKLVWKDFFTQRPFELTPEMQKIVRLLNDNLELSNTEIAAFLNKQKNTIDVQNKQILMRARESFPSHAFGNIKDVVRFLREIDYFKEDISENEKS